MPRTWFAVCAFAIVVVMVACSRRFGGSGRLTLGDLMLVASLELVTPLVLRSPLDLAHLHGSSLVQWSAALGTAIALLAILVHHQLRRE